ncbi:MULTISPECIES: D-amino acid dehydrogenase [Marinobacter]|uniref:D-amino acid dehydrogenase n=5 Tax=Marinobacteraceae TaxID=2887365 RepID=UPI002942895D|nr:D-amino acid dehydrogenase [Marinobacter salarius]WOI20370.1 D-amino acid dehydrogenase [Marinobacter salarius]
MKILVLGGGVAGVSTAWYLSNSGHEVTVVDRNPSVADETSFGNAGMLSYGYTNPWAAPGIPLKALKWMMQDMAPILVSSSAINARTANWMLQMLGQCTEEAYRINKGRMLRISEYSRICLDELTQEVPLDFDHRNKGTIELFRDDEKMVSIGADLESLKEGGVEHEVLNRESCIHHEPALANVSEKFVGGLRFPKDGTGDCNKFTKGLADHCLKAGVRFLLNTEVQSLETSSGKITGVETSEGYLKADAYVVALGSYSPLLLNPLGFRLPIYPIKGYSLTLPLLDETCAPQSTVMDEAFKVAVTRFEDRIRVGGTAEIAHFDLSLKDKRRKPAEFVVNDLFPNAGDLTNSTFWCGLRPMTPDSVPVIGKTPISNLFMNTGHGTLGWTMSQGSARLVADVINNKTPDIDNEGLSIDRFLK